MNAQANNSEGIEPSKVAVVGFGRLKLELETHTIPSYSLSTATSCTHLGNQSSLETRVTFPS